jgi:uncharacterized protein YjgD (DUF1641 family)
MIKIATTKSEIKEVLNNLADYEKVGRLSVLFGVDEIMEILGYFDGSLEDEYVEAIDETEDISLDRDNIVYSIAIRNKKFNESIARNRKVIREKELVV